MKNIVLLIITAVGLILGLNSCEQTVDAELPYTEQLVIKALLMADSVTQDISITRTLPPLGDYSDEAALVKDALAYIIGPGEKRYNLTYQESNKKYRVHNLIPRAGETYRLEVSARGKSAFSQTIIPEPVIIEKFEMSNELEFENRGYKSWINIVSAVFKPINNDVYISGHLKEIDYQGHAFYGKNYLMNMIKKNSDVYIDGKIRLPVEVSQTSDTTQFNIYMYQCWEFFVESYDNQFYAYYNSRYEGNSDNDIFGTSGSNVKWNIKGNGIGISFGVKIAKRLVE